MLLLNHQKEKIVIVLVAGIYDSVKRRTLRGKEFSVFIFYS